MILRYNDDKPHRCPECHAVAIDDAGSHRTARRMLTNHVVTCCRCGAEFTRFPWRDQLRFIGVVCTEHRGVVRSKS